MQAGVITGSLSLKNIRSNFLRKNLLWNLCFVCYCSKSTCVVFLENIQFENDWANSYSKTFNLNSLNWTPWKVSEFGVILVRIFPFLDWIQRDSKYGKVRIRRIPHTDPFYAVLVSVLESPFKYGFEVKGFCWLPVFKSFESGVAFHIENNYLHCKSNE